MVRIKSVAEYGACTATAACMHHWLIDSPEGPSSRGVCKLCGAIDEFKNYVPYPSWQDVKWKRQEPRMPKIELVKARRKFLEE
jgi:hypothetical protein